jgi:hypothetical protein
MIGLDVFALLIVSVTVRRNFMAFSVSVEDYTLTTPIYRFEEFSYEDMPMQQKFFFMKEYWLLLCESAKRTALFMLLKMVGKSILLWRSMIRMSTVAIIVKNPVFQVLLWKKWICVKAFCLEQKKKGRVFSDWTKNIPEKGEPYLCLKVYRISTGQINWKVSFVSL